MADRGVLPRSVLVECPHGDPTCPCPDELSCHYEGDDAYACPLLVLLEDEDGGRFSKLPHGLIIRVGDMHCHNEGCRWPEVECGLDKLGADIVYQPPVGSLRWRCGSSRTWHEGWAS